LAAGGSVHGRGRRWEGEAAPRRRSCASGRPSQVISVLAIWSPFQFTKEQWSEERGEEQSQFGLHSSFYFFIEASIHLNNDQWVNVEINITFDFGQIY